MHVNKHWNLVDNIDGKKTVHFSWEKLLVIIYSYFLNGRSDCCEKPTTSEPTGKMYLWQISENLVKSSDSSSRLFQK